jgi:hypothetical protein
VDRGSTATGEQCMAMADNRLGRDQTPGVPAPPGGIDGP